MWLPGLDSNQGFQLQRLTCYPYTTGQRSGPKLNSRAGDALIEPAHLYSAMPAGNRQGVGWQVLPTPFITRESGLLLKG